MLAPREIFENLVLFGAFWYIFWSDYVLKNFLKINIFLYRYTLAMGHLAPVEIFENMLQLKRFGVYSERILSRNRLLSYRNSDISYSDARGFGDMLPAKILKWLMQSGAFWCIILIRLSPKKYNKIIITTHPATLLLSVTLTEKLKKVCSSWCVFIIFGIKIAIVTYWGPFGIIFGSTPKVLEKKWTI